MPRPMNSIPDTPRPGKFNTWGTKKRAEEIEAGEKEFER